ncbi:response regulator [Sphingobacterium sp.]|uniref:response regulator n=1 Tax=Sphingobacterium sp. TaxID=341027 RepID=UPI00289998F7|nr:response regulator [Sphingobacterium sp.]
MSAKKIMICDDNRGILDVLEMYLELEGFTVVTVINSTELIKDILTHKPDLLLLDLWMPILSGDQVLKIIRNTRDIASLPVIILSASTDGGTVAAEIGANDFIAKPFDLNDVTAKIKDICG